jgi:hypothetical protein
MVSGLGSNDGFDLDVGELRDVSRALAARAVAFAKEERVAVRADFVEELCPDAHEDEVVEDAYRRQGDAHDLFLRLELKRTPG